LLAPSSINANTEKHYCNYSENFYTATAATYATGWQSRKAKPKIQYKLQSKYKGKVYKATIELVRLH